MKTLFRICLVLVILAVLLVGVAYFVVTRPGFQKNLIESKLPPGSSLKEVQITTGSLELSELILQMPDGTRLKVARLDSDFSPLAAIFDQTIQLKGLELDGLFVELPQNTTQAPTSPESLPGEAPAQTPEVSKPAPVQPPIESASPTDALYALGHLDWLFDIDSIQLNGAVLDAQKNRYAFTLNSGAIAPGAETELEASLKLESSQAIQGGLKDFASDVRVQFKQNTNGGFEHVRIESITQGSDTAGTSLISASQTLELSVDGFAETAQLDLDFNVDLPRPEVFASELSALNGLSLQGEISGAAEGPVLTLNTADLQAASNGNPVANVVLQQAITLGAQQKFTGELMDVTLSNLPLAWINPWLGNGLQLSGAPLSAQIALSGESDGALEVITRQPVQMGPFSLAQNGLPLLEGVTVRMDPIIRVEADQTIRYDLQNFQLLDRYGDVVSGTLTGSKSPSTAASPFAGLETKARLQVGLAELLNQPALAGKASVLAGQAQVQLDLDGAAEFPAKLQTAITGLRAREMPGARQDYRLAAQLKRSDSGTLSLGANFEAGSENRATTSIQVSGQVHPERQPLPFKVQLSSPRVTQSDIDLLMAALATGESAAAPTQVNRTTPTRTTSATPTTPRPRQQLVERPPWAELDGDVAVEIDSFQLVSGQIVRGITADATISEPSLAVTGIQAALGEGRIDGDAKVDFDPNEGQAYQVRSTLGFKNVDPSVFSKKRSGSFPVKGLFDGEFNLAGAGDTLEGAFDASEGALTVTGRDGLLTAFELDNRSQLGLLGAGILGRQLDRPGITAMAQAVPYFKDMRFDNFTLKLTRGQDRKVRIPELKFLGENVRIEGEGFIAASSLGDVLNQPLTLSLGLGAKGRLVEYLETLQLLGPNTSEDGFRHWKNDINIGGTLGDPDTGELQRILSNAARHAVKGTKPPAPPSPAPSTPAEGDLILPDHANQQPPATGEPAQESDDEQLRDDIEMGLDLLNSILGD